MKQTITVLLAMLCNAAVAQPTFLNGSFEINTHPAGACNWSYLNMTNVLWNSTVSFSNAYGTSESLDLMHTTCTWGPAQNGNFFAGVDYSNGNAFTLTLSAPLTAGTTYTISFWDKGDPCCPPAGPMQIGLSTVNNATGTIIYTGVPSTIGVWNNRVFSFVAPFAAQYISIQGTAGAFWSNVDNFTFQTPLPASFSSFEAYRTAGNKNKITWMIDQPEHYSVWYLDRSTDGIHFSEQYEIPSANGITTYSQTDSVSGVLPVVYYRIRGKDLDGNMLVSEILELPLHASASQQVLQVFPNPLQTGKELHISWVAGDNGLVALTMYDLTGRLVFKEERTVYTGQQEIILPALDLLPGCYLLRIGNHSQKLTLE